jgi:5-formyltetrahydrofolate cyclo-ligase
MIEKSKLRKQYKEIRDAIPKEMRHAYSLKIAQRIRESQIYKEEQLIYCYSAFRSEVETAAFLNQALTDDKTVALPKVEGDAMVFYAITDKSQLKSGAFGILEPDGGAVIEEPGLMLLPGLAFDKAGHRMGYGGGFYDRYLADHAMNCKLALAFEGQIVPTVATQPHDQRVDGIVTEKRLYLLPR